MIDAHWLQREIQKYVMHKDDPAKIMHTEQKILKLLEIDDVQQLENELVALLDYSNFDFLRTLCRNKTKILYIVWNIV